MAVESEQPSQKHRDFVGTASYQPPVVAAFVCLNKFARDRKFLLQDYSHEERQSILHSLSL